MIALGFFINTSCNVIMGRGVGTKGLKRPRCEHPGTADSQRVAPCELPSPVKRRIYWRRRTKGTRSGKETRGGGGGCGNSSFTETPHVTNGDSLPATLGGGRASFPHHPSTKIDVLMYARLDGGSRHFSSSCASGALGLLSRVSPSWPGGEKEHASFITPSITAIRIGVEARDSVRI